MLETNNERKTQYFKEHETINVRFAEYKEDLFEFIGEVDLRLAVNYFRQALLSSLTFFVP
jgi:hypothetical protein